MNCWIYTCGFTAQVGKRGISNIFNIDCELFSVSIKLKSKKKSLKSWLRSWGLSRVGTEKCEGFSLFEDQSWHYLATWSTVRGSQARQFWLDGRPDVRVSCTTSACGDKTKSRGKMKKRRENAALPTFNTLLTTSAVISSESRRLVLNIWAFIVLFSMSSKF